MSLAVSLFATDTASAPAETIYGSAPPSLVNDLARLVRSYPEWITGHHEGFLIMKDGTRFRISDGVVTKSFNQMLDKPDIDDMFYVSYPAGTTPKQPSRNSDPGRVRYEPLFVAMYGDCRKNEVARKLKRIDWLPRHGGGQVAITSVNAVDQALGAVSQELERLPPELIKFAIPAAGGYVCREIAGTNNRSMHAYAAAIDLNPKYSDYWRWASGRSEPIWKNRIPIEIVRIFERHGFIWGGYWFHYDTMHFEYRPELLPDGLATRSE